MFQQWRRVSDTTIIGISIYDLNEMRLTPERATFVPLGVTVKDLWASRATPDLTQRILAQYAMAYVRVAFPTAGDADQVLVGLRSKAADLFGMQAGLDVHTGVVREKKGVLDVQDASDDVSEWTSGHVLRRLDLLRQENHGVHEFVNGPKDQALRRLLVRGQKQGRVIVVVLPMSQYYMDTFLDQSSIAVFERELQKDLAMRLDKGPGISANKHFLDLVHLNTSGRRLLTPVFLEEVKQATSKAMPSASFAATEISQNQ